jgi:hypothetical protein
MSLADGGDLEGRHHAIFIVRVNRDSGGKLTGVIERVRTGEKIRVEALAEVEQVLASMLAREPIE